MLQKHYGPGSTRSFKFENSETQIINGAEIIIFETEFIESVTGTLEDKFGNNPVYKPFKGKVYMKEEFIYDTGFQFLRQQIKYTDDKRIIIPKKGLYCESFLSKLYLDIDINGRVWLTDKMFYEVSLYKKLGLLKMKLKDTQKMIKETLEEIKQVNIEKAEAEMYNQMIIDEQRKLEG